MKITEGGSKEVVIVYPKLGMQGGRPDLPLQALALAGPLLQAGFGVTIIDERVEDDVRAALGRLRGRPVCFGISAMLSHQPKSGLRIAQWIRDDFAGAPIVWGGWFPTILPMITIADPRVDIVVKGKGEVTFVDLVTALYENRPLHGIAGLVYKEGGRIIETADRQLEDPNQFPFKPYHLLPLEKYEIADGILNFNSSYGCPFRCKFCSINTSLKKQWNGGLTPERVLDEIEDIISRHGIKVRLVAFQEDNFFHDRERARRILQLLADRGQGLSWKANMRIDQFLRFDHELLALISRSGCAELGAGAESAHQPMLDAISKDLKVEQIEKAVLLAREYGINMNLNFIAGLPGETGDGYKETLKNIRRFLAMNPGLRRKNIRIYQYFPIPGTPLYQQEYEKGLINAPRSLEEWSEIASEYMVLNPLASRSTITAYSNDLYRIMSFYFTAAYMMDTHHARLIVRLLKKVFRKISRMRFENNVWSFPWEWYLMKMARR